MCRAWSFLHGACAGLYLFLAGLILLHRKRSRTGLWLAGASLVTAIWAIAVAASWHVPILGAASWLEIARSVAWYGFVLHLYRQTIGGQRQIRQAFTTMGLLALMMVVGLPLVDHLSHDTGGTIWLVGVATRLAFAVGSILLLENLYFNTAPDQRWNINLLCIALGGVFFYDLVLYSDALLFHRVSPGLFEARAPAMALAAPLLALAAVRNRRWSIDIHVSREVVFHSATLVLCRNLPARPRLHR